MTPMQKRPQRDELTTDAALLERAVGGERTALGLLYDRHAQAVYGFARRILTREEAEDVVQVTFIRIADIAASFDGRNSNARSWIFGIAYRVMGERRRKTSRLREILREFRAGESRVANAPGAHDAIDLDRALARLSEGKRAVLVLTQVHGFSSEEAAEILGLPVGTVWTRLHHARRELRELLEENR
jgi:RNA polymerase sigma-70 factor, ECF subfamily